MVSGAGHDAMILAARVPAAMLFLRSPGGISHHPDETVLDDDVAAALAVGTALLDGPGAHSCLTGDSRRDGGHSGSGVAPPTSRSRTDVISAIGPELPGATRRDRRARPDRLPGPDRRARALQRTRAHGMGRRGHRQPGAGRGRRHAVLRHAAQLHALHGRSPRPSTRSARRSEQSSVTDFALWGGIVPGNRERPGGTGRARRDRLQSLHVRFRPARISARRRSHAVRRHARSGRALGLPVAVHAESEEITAASRSRIREAGRSDVRDYLDSRPVVAEVEAIHRAALLAREAGASCTSSTSAPAAAWRRRWKRAPRGTDISIETCPHYLFFTEEDMVRIGAVAKCAPPLRGRASATRCGAHLLDGDIDMVASDHSPALARMKTRRRFLSHLGRHRRRAIHTRRAARGRHLARACVAGHRPTRPPKLRRAVSAFPTRARSRWATTPTSRWWICRTPLPWRRKTCSSSTALSPYTGRPFAARVAALCCAARPSFRTAPV